MAALFPLCSFAIDNPINDPQEESIDYYRSLVEEGSYDEAVDSYKTALGFTTEKKERAILHKGMGDVYVLMDDMENAAEEFIQALSLSDNFSEKDKVQMAVYIAWGDRLDDAINTLKQVLAESPSNTEARVHLARTLSWAGRYEEAIMEAETVLSEPLYRSDALLVKANSLNWGGDAKSAIPLYQDVLYEGENFGARLGLTYCLLSTGNVKDAEKSYLKLKPQYPYQDKEYNKITGVIDYETKSAISLGYNYYNDSDHNRYNRYWIHYSFPVNNWKTILGYELSDTWDKTRDNDSYELFVKTYVKLTESVGVGGGLGTVWVGSQNGLSIFSWHIKADKDVLRGKVGAHIVRKVGTETAELIENEITITNIGGYLSQDLTSRISVYGSYDYKDYSDDNSAVELQFVPRYKINILDPSVTISYKWRYVDFNKQTGDGYFDPSNFISHQISLALYQEKNRHYYYVEPYIGFQSFKRYGEKSSDWIGGASGSYGFKLKRGVVLEMSAEGGNFSLNTTSGFSYYLLGINLLILI